MIGKSDGMYLKREGWSDNCPHCNESVQYPWHIFFVCVEEGYFEEQVQKAVRTANFVDLMIVSKLTS